MIKTQILNEIWYLIASRKNLQFECLYERTVEKNCHEKEVLRGMPYFI